MTPVVTLANAQFFRGSGWRQIWLERGRKIKSPLEVWVPRDPYSGRPGAPVPRRNPGVLNCGNVMDSLTTHPLLPRTEKKGHTHTRTW